VRACGKPPAGCIPLAAAGPCRSWLPCCTTPPLSTARHCLQRHMPLLMLPHLPISTPPLQDCSGRGSCWAVDGRPCKRRWRPQGPSNRAGLRAQLPSPGKLTLNVNTGSSCGWDDETPAESMCVESLGWRRAYG
jgi:hypothetical protein